MSPWSRAERQSGKGLGEQRYRGASGSASRLGKSHVTFLGLSFPPERQGDAGV